MTTRVPTALAALVLSALGCSDSPTENNGSAWTLRSDAGVFADSGATECVTDADCGEDSHCFHPIACGSPARCEPGYSGCSAAAPFQVCGCDGRVTSAAAGCPGSYAWEIGELDYDSLGVACDASAVAPFTFQVTVSIVDDPVFAEGTLYAKVPAAPELGTFEVGESRTVEFAVSGDQWSYFGLDLLVDRDGDGRCTIDIDEDFATADEAQDIDFESFEVVRQVSKSPVSAPCERWP